MLLSILMTFICRSEAKGAVTGCIGIKYPNIKKCILAPTPETSCPCQTTGVLVVNTQQLIFCTHFIHIIYSHAMMMPADEGLINK